MHALSLALYKRNKKLHPRALFSYISTWEFLKALEKCKKYSAAPCASLCTSLVFFKNPGMLIKLNNALWCVLNFFSISPILTVVVNLEDITTDCVTEILKSFSSFTCSQ